MKATMREEPDEWTLSKPIQKEFDRHITNRRLKHSAPAVNIGETDHAVLIQIALPGYTKECIKIERNENVLHVTVKPTVETLSRMWKYSKKEIDTGGRDYEFPMQFNIPSNITVTYKAGLLNIVLPKKGSDLLQQQDILIL